jgi:hypothetical protein
VKEKPVIDSLDAYRSRILEWMVTGIQPHLAMKLSRESNALPKKPPA